MQFDLITIFPKIFDSYFNESILARAQKTKKIKIKIHNLRDYSSDKRKTVDDKPYGGGVGMVMKIEPLYKAIKSIKSKVHKVKSRKSKVILLSAKGKRLNQQLANKFSKLDNLILICGRYEGVDERIKYFIDEEVSIGDYVLTGGEIPALVIVDAVSRLLPGVLGKDESNKEESHSQAGVLEYPHYTRPADFIFFDNKKNKKLKIPPILLSGDHKKIQEWRQKKMKSIS